MADTSKDELLLGGGIRLLAATSQYHAHRKQVPAYVSNIVYKQRANFWQYFDCLHERIFN